jgi:hypothetical protein
MKHALLEAAGERVMTRDSGDPKGGRDPYAEIYELRCQLADLRNMVGNVAQANALEQVVERGLDNLVAQLQPLRDLTPARDPLPDESVQKLMDLQNALRRPKWRGSDFEVEATRRRRLEDACIGSTAS